jgi:hypothetical protein
VKSLSFGLAVSIEETYPTLLSAVESCSLHTAALGGLRGIEVAFWLGSTGMDF